MFQNAFKALKYELVAEIQDTGDITFAHALFMLNKKKKKSMPGPQRQKD